jgi:uncharacterized protein YvpB
MKLKAIQNTALKQVAGDSLSLSEQGELWLQPGRVLSIYDWKPLDRNYLKVVLDISAENFNQVTWFAYVPHVHLLDDNGEVKAIPQSFPSAINLLKVPYNHQVDELHPIGASNVTSFAMVLSYFRVKRTRNNIWLMEDEVYQHLEANKLNRWNPIDLVKLASSYGLKDDFTMRGCLSDMRQAIAEGNLCIVHDRCISPGNTIVIRGYDQNGFYVNDPYGRWTSSVYRHDLSGENIYYSNEFIRSKYSPEGEGFLWLHILTKK